MPNQTNLPKPVTLRSKRAQEFWREFIDGINQNECYTRLKQYENLHKTNLNGFLDVPINELIEKIQDYIELEQAENSNLEALHEFMQLLHENYNLNPETTETLRNFLDKFSGWLAFEDREKNYLKQMVEAKALRTSYRKPINASFLCELHKKCMSNVKNTTYDSFDSSGVKERPGEFRFVLNPSFPLKNFFLGSNTSQKGIEECLDSFFKGEQDFKLQFFNESLNLLISVTGDELNPERLIIDYAPYLRHYGWEEVQKREIDTLTHKIKEISTDKAQLAMLLFSFVSNNEDWHAELVTNQKRSDLATGHIEKRVNAEFSNYYQNLKALDGAHLPEDLLQAKIKETARLVQLLERLHPFKDGNCRTIIMQLLPKLLDNLGLGNTFIFDDPNRFDMFSVAECYNEIIKALENAKNINLNIPCALSNECITSSLLQRLSNKQQEYFQNCLKQYKQILSLESSSRISHSFFATAKEKTAETSPTFHKNPTAG